MTFWITKKYVIASLLSFGIIKHFSINVTPQHRVQIMEKYSVATKWKDRNEVIAVPNIIHVMILGENPPQHFIEMAKFNANLAKQNGFEFVVWKDADANTLVKSQERRFPGIQKAWQNIQDYPSNNTGARKADFMRIVVMWAIGGVNIDADFITCSSLDFMVDEPGVVSFPYMPRNIHEVDGAVMSSPPHHRLFGLALETIIGFGDSIRSFNNLRAAGPGIMAEIVDNYFTEKGFSIESVFNEDDKTFTAEPVEGVITTYTADYWEAEVVDIRFRGNTAAKNLYHIGTRSWINGLEMKSKCFEHPELIIPYFEGVCARDQSKITNARGPNFEQECGASPNTTSTIE